MGAAALGFRFDNFATGKAVLAQALLRALGQDGSGIDARIGMDDALQSLLTQWLRREGLDGAPGRVLVGESGWSYGSTPQQLHLGFYYGAKRYTIGPALKRLKETQPRACRLVHDALLYANYKLGVAVYSPEAVSHLAQHSLWYHSDNDEDLAEELKMLHAGDSDDEKEIAAAVQSDMESMLLPSSFQLAMEPYLPPSRGRRDRIWSVPRSHRVLAAEIATISPSLAQSIPLAVAILRTAPLKASLHDDDDQPVAVIANSLIFCDLDDSGEADDMAAEVLEAYGNQCQDSGEASDVSAAREITDAAAAAEYLADLATHIRTLINVIELLEALETYVKDLNAQH